VKKITTPWTHATSNPLRRARSVYDIFGGKLEKLDDIPEIDMSGNVDQSHLTVRTPSSRHTMSSQNSNLSPQKK
jgi:hypothetical protein